MIKLLPTATHRLLTACVLIMFTAVAYTVLSPLGVFAGVSAIPLVGYIIWWMSSTPDEEYEIEIIERKQ